MLKFFIQNGSNKLASQTMSQQKSSLECVEPSILSIPVQNVMSLENEGEVKIENQGQQPKIEEDLPFNQIEGMSIEDHDGSSLVQKHDDAMSIEVKREKEEDENQIIDLNHYLFNGIVGLCKKEGLIQYDVAHSFQHNHTIGVDKRYLKCYRSGNFKGFNFQSNKIHLYDHRKLTKMLVDHNPSKYIPFTKPERPYDFNKQTQQFFKQIYEMSETDYQRNWSELVLVNCQSWWGGPQKIDPICDPPVKFYQTEDGRQIRIQKEATQIQTPQKEKQRNDRIRNQKTIKQDIIQISKMMNINLFGSSIKVQNSQDGRSSKGDSEASGKGHNKKEKKVKKENKEKKEKKDKKKKHKKEKKNKDEEPKREDQSQPEETKSKKKKK